MIMSFSSVTKDMQDDTLITGWVTTSMLIARGICPKRPMRPTGRRVRWRESSNAGIRIAPAFWFISYRHPHPPIVPLQTYLDLYRDIRIDEPYHGSWSTCSEDLSLSLQATLRGGLNSHRTRPSPPGAPSMPSVRILTISCGSLSERCVKKVSSTIRLSVLRPITAICSATMVCGRSDFSTNTPPTSR